jgi:DNA-binding NarL/FixJ family response regulator
MRILLADDHALVLEGIHHVLEADGGFEVVAVARSGAEVLPLIARHSPEVVLLDVRLPKLDGLECLSRIRSRYPAVSVVMLSMFGDAEQLQLAFELGACGYVTKNIDAADLGPAIRQAVGGAAFQAFGLSTVDESRAATSAGLTERELTVLRAVARGQSNDAVAKELWVTEQTVKFHLTNVYRKIGVANRTEAARWAFAQGVVETIDPSAATRTAA